MDNFIFYEWRKVEDSGEWTTFKRGVRNAAAAKPPFQILKQGISPYTTYQIVCQVSIYPQYEQNMSQYLI